jgi:hypothetical protein
MRLEHVPILLGLAAALLGLGFACDALLPQPARVSEDRRRRSRIERNRIGELLVGLGMLCLAVSLFTPDRWRYAILIVAAATVFIAVGASLNGRYLAQEFLTEGVAGRAPLQGTASDRNDLRARLRPLTDREAQIVTVTDGRAAQGSSADEDDSVTSPPANRTPSR